MSNQKPWLNIENMETEKYKKVMGRSPAATPRSRKNAKVAPSARSPRNGKNLWPMNPQGIEDLPKAP